MTVVVRTAIRMALPVLAVAGLYLVAWGYSPGGGFPGGAVLVGVLLLAYAGFGRRMVGKVVRPGLLEAIEMVGAGAIVGTELLGLLLRGSFSANWLPLAAPQTILSGGVAQLFSVSELIEVGTGLAIVIFALIGMGHDWSPDEPPGGTGASGTVPDAGTAGRWLVILVNYLAAVALLGTGLYAVLTRRNMIKMVMGLSLMEAATYLFMISLAYRAGSTAPVLVGPPPGKSAQDLVHGNVADPVLQNFCLTAVVIGVAVTAVFLSVVVRIAQHYRTLDSDRVREMRG